MLAREQLDIVSISTWPHLHAEMVIAAAEAELAGNGRVLIRASGTEPVIRVMAEGDDAGQVEAVVGRICDAVKRAAA